MKRTMALFFAMTLSLPVLAVEWAGAYDWVSTPEEQAACDQAVEKAAESAPMMIRTVVRKRLVAGTVPYPGVRFAVTNDVVTFLRTPGNRPVVAVLDGPPVAWEREDGKTYQVVLTKEGTGLRQTFTNEDGTRVNAFSWSKDGAVLRMTVTINASVLKVPVVYTLTFHRKP